MHFTPPSRTYLGILKWSKLVSEYGTFSVRISAELMAKLKTSTFFVYLVSPFKFSGDMYKKVPIPFVMFVSFANSLAPPKSVILRRKKNK